MRFFALACLSQCCGPNLTAPWILRATITMRTAIWASLLSAVSIGSIAGTASAVWATVPAPLTRGVPLCAAGSGAFASAHFTSAVSSSFLPLSSTAETHARARWPDGCHPLDCNPWTCDPCSIGLADCDDCQCETVNIDAQWCYGCPGTAFGAWSSKLTINFWGRSGGSCDTLCANEVFFVCQNGP